MDIYLAPEHAYHLIPQYTLEVARDRVEQKKASLVAGTVGALLSRPKPEEIQLAGAENRLEPFWHIAISARTVFDRNRTLAIGVTGPEVQRVTVLGQDVVVDPKAKGGPAIALPAVEHCLDEQRASRTFDAVTGAAADFGKYLSATKTEIADLAAFAPEGVLVVPPQKSATVVVRQVMSEVVKPVQQAQIIHEERVNVEAADLNFRPVYAFEYDWTAKGKRTVVEFDAVTGDMRTGGKALGDQLKNVKNMLTRDLLFDVTADALSMVVPGGGIAVKLVRAVVDRGKQP
jgi:hypothetical protein